MLNNRRKNIHKLKLEDKQQSVRDDLKNMANELMSDDESFSAVVNEDNIDDILNPSKISKVEHQLQDDIITILRRLGLSKQEDFYVVDVGQIFRYTYDCGFQNKFADKDILNMFRKDIYKHINIQKINGDYDEHIVYKFLLTDSAKWKKTNKSISIVGHSDTVLVCPNCKNKYKDMNKVMYIQTISIQPMNLSFDNNVKSNVKAIAPQIILTPICPQCYCDKLVTDIISDNMNSIRNLSPVTTVPSPSEGVYHLVPECFTDRLTGGRFWPKDEKDIMCKSKNNKDQ